MGKLLQFFERKWVLISGTVIVCGAVFAFFYARMVELKDQQIHIKDDQIQGLEKQVQNLSNVGTMSNALSNLNSNFQSLERRVSSVLVMTKFDPLTGGAEIGGEGAGIGFPTPLNKLLVESLDYVDKKKYDQALKKADEMDKLVPGFAGALYVRFLSFKSKGFTNEAVGWAEKLIATIPDDKRIPDAYEMLVEYYWGQGRKKDAEELALRALKRAPDSKDWQEFFKSKFGYLPSLAEKTE